MAPNLILAGSYEQARYWAVQLGFTSLREWQYLGPHAIRGRRGGTIYLVGTYFDRPDWPEILDAIIPTGALVVDGQEMVDGQ